MSFNKRKKSESSMSLPLLFLSAEKIIALIKTKIVQYNLKKIKDVYKL
jgi:hypothetical protein